MYFIWLQYKMLIQKKKTLEFGKETHQGFSEVKMEVAEGW
jgi:hypothetical protein